MNLRDDAASRVALIDSAECGLDVRTFRFQRPEEYGFLAGQYFTLTLETREGPQAHHFSFASSPRDEWLEIGTRMTGSAFKDALAALRPGDEVTVSGPKGRLTLPEEVRKVAFLVGGVGITPARSIMRETDQRGTGLRVALFYGNRDEACIPYRDEFRHMEAHRSEIVVVDVLGAPSVSWTGERGFITADLVRRHIVPNDGRHFFVAGPPPMIEPMKTVLDQLAIPPERRHIEAFSGYQ